MILGVAVLIVVVAVGGWRYWSGRRSSAPTEANASPMHTETSAKPANEQPRQPLIVEATDDIDPPAPTFTFPKESHPAAEDEVLKPIGASDVAAAKPESTQSPSDPPDETPMKGDSADTRASDNPTIEAARRQYAAGKLIEARHALNALLSRNLSRTEQAEVRELLGKIADETIFSKRRLPDDPLVSAYTVQSGDVLVRIGNHYDVPAEALMRINGIRDARNLRADQTIKVLKGPFNVRIYSSEFRLEVYLQDLYLRSYRVALGADQGTPMGVWRVKERLDNPTYYPSPSAEDKRIIAANDPANPLGERWIGLEGIEGDAKGRFGYGIHGTIEPESIGKAVSLGCVRMHNEDVAFLYDLMQPGKSTVTILP